MYKVINICSHKIFIGICFILLVSCSSKINHFARYQDQTIRLDEGTSETDKNIDAMISPYRDKLSATMDEVIAVSDQELVKRKPSSNMGNWMCDALMSGTRAIYSGEIDFVIQNYGGLRINSLAKGNVTVGNIFELMPFENFMVIAELDGENTKKLLDKIAESGGWPVSREISFYISDQKTAENIKINGKEFDINKTYWIATSDYVVNGGDNMDFFRQAPIVETGKLIRDILIDECKRTGKIISDNSSRIYTTR